MLGYNNRAETERTENQSSHTARVESMENESSCDNGDGS